LETRRENLLGSKIGKNLPGRYGEREEPIWSRAKRKNQLGVVLKEKNLPGSLLLTDK
jgi:hypothetical protein